MSILTESDVRYLAKSLTRTRSADSILKELSQTNQTRFDIFLSHSRLDAEIILGVKKAFENAGKTVYVDWVNDPYLDRTCVTPQTAHRLRQRMHQSDALFYVHSMNSVASKWMPWELGFFDGFNGNVAIVPITQNQTSQFKGEEYLGLYPYVDLTAAQIYIHRSLGDYVQYPVWKTGRDKMRPL